MDKHTHPNSSAKNYLFQSTHKPIPPDLAAFEKCGIFSVTGIVHCLQTGAQTEVKKGFPVRFDHFSSTLGDALLQNKSEVVLNTNNECLALLWYTACVSPQFGTTASLEVKVNGDIVAGGSASAQSSYQIGVEMALSALTVVRLHNKPGQVIELINCDNTADIAHSSLVLVLIDAAPPMKDRV